MRWAAPTLLRGVPAAPILERIDGCFDAGEGFEENRAGAGDIHAFEAGAGGTEEEAVVKSDPGLCPHEYAECLIIQA